jgi:branched-chain amino acid transport system permease protein
MHAPLWHARVIGRLVPSYLMALAAGLVMLLGACLTIEMLYHVSTKVAEGPEMSFMHVRFSVHSVLPWLVAAVLLAGGYFLSRLTWPHVQHAWHEALDAARERRGA